MTTSNTDPFYSAKRRLARAKKHAADFESVSDAFIKSKPYVIAVDLDSDGVTKLHKIKLVKPFPEDTLSDIATDAFDNLRSVLDQTVYAASLASGNTPGEFTSFIITETAKYWEDRAKGGLSQIIPSDIFALFRGFKPYKGGNDLLWGLNKLRNVNQHALLAPLGTSSIQVTGAPIVMQAPPDGSISMMNLPLWSPFTWDRCKNEMIIFRESPGGHLSYDFELSPTVSFGQVAVFYGEPVLGAFNRVAGIVESILMATEAECRRLGFVP
jgi:hypothetical protein